MTERVLPRDFPTVPEFIIPLSNAEILELGTFTALWSQIDVLMTFALSSMLRIPVEDAEIIMNPTTTGVRAGMLSKLGGRSDDPIDKQIKKLVDSNGGLIDDRNHIMHGMWFIHWGEPDWVPSTACFYYKEQKPIFATKLAELSNRAARFSSELGALIEKKNPLSFRGVRPRRMFSGAGNAGDRGPPTWPPK